MVDNVILDCAVDPARVSFLLGPTHFYRQICGMYRNAKKRVVLACLYVGNGLREEQLIREILENKKRNSDLVVDVLVDKSRTMRMDNSGTTITSLRLLKPYLAPGNGVDVALFHNPLYGRLLSKIIKSPYCEAFGTMHMKVYIGDDECVLTGANAGRDYFCDRYDRYMVVQDPVFCDIMHTFVKTFQTASFTFTERLTAEWRSDLMNPIDDNMLFRKQLYVRVHQMVRMCKEILKTRYAQRDSQEFSRITKRRYTQPVADSAVHSTLAMQPEDMPLMSGTTQLSGSETSGDVKDLDILQEPKSGIVSGMRGTDSSQKPTAQGYEAECKTLDTNKHGDEADTIAIAGSCKSHETDAAASVEESDSSDKRPRPEGGQTDGSQTATDSEASNAPCDTTRMCTDETRETDEYCHIKICIQMPFSEPSFMQGENLLEERIIQYVKKGYSIFIATAYLNFTDRLLDLFREIVKVGKKVGKHNPLQVVTSSPYANSFYNDGTLKRNIALLYSTTATWLLSAVKQGNGYPQDIYMEYNRPNHTFHAKGIWVLKERVPLDASRLSEEEFDATTSLPCSMVIGSSNYGRRSCEKDLEVIFFVETNSPKLRKFMKQELYEMIKHSEYVSYETLARRVGLQQRIASAVLKAFL
ncbi:putative phosphatidylglycerophosphate synthase [Babesia divergens]|uniref:CDP-diacylglycerol--glycerol-3-phosphate 3-phosphatidyltransferase n=1 Tax=Babesia divergens TaxID=32595 RepID=A0AAD9GCV2_BABDI|nr:putative phosphatidylglycerophosphate synthase [Babesia divergens]